MDQASKPDDSRERAVSSEPCSTRPNPFDDSDNPNKRRRTSNSGASSSRSVDTVGGSPSRQSPAAEDLDPQVQNDSAMKIDTDPNNPRTPDNQQALPSEPRSSRVTINVRTPSRPLEAIPSSPASPRDSVTVAAATPSNDVKASVEESEAELLPGETMVDTPESSASNASSPPVEIISGPTDDEHDFDNAGHAVTMLHGYRVPQPDPASRFPFHEEHEQWAETVQRLTQYMTTHEQVTGDIAKWIDEYLSFTEGASLDALMESYSAYRSLWISIPDLVFHMIGRRTNYYRYTPDLKAVIFTFYRSFAKLAAHFLDLDLQVLQRSPHIEPIQADLASENYIHALALLTGKEELGAQENHLINGVGGALDDDWSYTQQALEVLAGFQNTQTNQGGTLAHLRQLAQIVINFVPRAPKFTENLSWIVVLSSNIVRDSCTHLVNEYTEEQARSNAARGYALFKDSSATLASIIDKNVNHLSHESALHLISGLTDIYQKCISEDRIVPLEVIQHHQQTNPPVHRDHLPVAMSYHWRFEMFTKLIMSSQMQLRVMAVTTMCADLVNFWRLYGEPAVEANTALLKYFADFLLRKGLVSYILGPTCHPEITVESGNIIGFLVVSKTYTNEHTDALWHTFLSTQDPRISDALMRMLPRITNLFALPDLIYICEKLIKAPIEAFTPSVRELCDALLRNAAGRQPLDRSLQDTAPFELCIRLLRQATTIGQQAPIAFPEIHNFAIVEMRKLLLPGPLPAFRQAVYVDCLRDIEQKSPTSLGSLWVIYLMTRGNRDLKTLTGEHDFTRLLIEEMEAAVSIARSTVFPAVLSGSHNQPRRELIGYIVSTEPSTIAKDLGRRLWDVLVGGDASCREDRDTAWMIMNHALRGTADGAQTPNPFLSTCFSDYLPSLASDYFCPGALTFVRDTVLPLVNDPASILLDEEDNASFAGIEQLWRFILTASEPLIAKQAIRTLVKDIYIDSRSISGFPHHRARKVHLALVNRCLRQMSSATMKLKSFSDGTASGDDEPMVIVATEEELHQQELLFLRSLVVLGEFHSQHKSKTNFRAPDLRLLMAEAPGDVEGESADLKYQAFDGKVRTDVRPLNIGKKNTAASLLACLRETTGFKNYRVYYSGRLFTLQESEICKSLEELQIQHGIILVKREPDTPTAKSRPGASPIDLEILGHFDELWEYLAMEDKLAQEVYSFLIKLPADEGLLRSIEDSAKSHKDIFPQGQPLKSLYAVYAIRYWITSHQGLKAGTGGLSGSREEASENSPASLPASISRALSLIVAALCDFEVIAQCPSPELQIELGGALVECFVALVTDRTLPVASYKLLNADLLEALVAVSTKISSSASEDGTARTILCLEGIFASCLRSGLFWVALCSNDAASVLLRNMLLDDNRPEVRKHAAGHILGQSSKPESMSPVPGQPSFLDFFWPFVCGLVGPALSKPYNCMEIMQLCFSLLPIARKSRSQLIDISHLLREWGSLLLSYTTFEDITQPDMVDNAAYGLIRLLHSLVHPEKDLATIDQQPFRGLSHNIFWRHLFPPFAEYHHDSQVLELAKPIITERTRKMLVQIVLNLAGQNRTELSRLLTNLNAIVPYSLDDTEESYAYELMSHQFDRSKAIRASCGYVGLRNLSNTCYLNSLFTQLFMNVEFRRFMINAEVQDPEETQALLFQTKKLFGYMQESIRRSFSPEDCVYAIKLSDENNKHIDVNNQMDVDEFYNLLFDRLEGQLITAEAKRKFHSFYGGQLVQQVKSQECEHVSEVFELFSTIQCDIKGKSSLQESLQAYVDGEIMQGDNKYKCSACDHHVDAVKRTCLKNIPDNLIFHLKRFDFNLRTMQRSKINDHFTFPLQIDMRPYTIEHLSNPGEQGPEDIFELVGILVHSGTAEAGHYYSFIRERPDRSEAETWIEFNDENVSAWDPALMEAACFGGPEHRGPFDNNTMVFDKTYSAYMLFYQRSSTLTKQDHLSARELSQQGPLPRAQRLGPHPVPLDKGLADHIQHENMQLIRRHCLYDPIQVDFAQFAVARMKTFFDGRCSKEHDIESIGIELLLSHFDQVASRTKDTPNVRSLLLFLQQLCVDCPSCSFAVFDYFSQRHDVFRQLLQRTPESEVREGIKTLILGAIQKVKTDQPFRYGIESDDTPETPGDMTSADPGTVLVGMMGMIKHLFDFCHVTLRSWPEVFTFMHDFVKMGVPEMAAFLKQPFLKNLLYIICADTALQQDLPQQFHRLAAAVSRRMPNRPPSYDEIIALLDELIPRMYFFPHENMRMSDFDVAERAADTQEDGQVCFPFHGHEIEILLLDWKGRYSATVFMDKLISIDQNVNATLSILTHLAKADRMMEERLGRTIRLGINAALATHSNAPYLRAAYYAYCTAASSLEGVHRLISHVAGQCANIQSNDGLVFFQFLRDVTDNPRHITLESPLEAVRFCMHLIPTWAPNLLGYLNVNVANEVERWLAVRLFGYGIPPNLDETQGGQHRANMVVQTARALGVQCLLWLQDHYVEPHEPVAKYLVDAVERVIKECTKYFDLGHPADDKETLEFVQLLQHVLEPLRRLKVEEIEEEGSDWENSSDLGSDQMDSLGDISMQATGDLQDADLQ